MADGEVLYQKALDAIKDVFLDNITDPALIVSRLKIIKGDTGRFIAAQEFLMVQRQEQQEEEKENGTE